MRKKRNAARGVRRVNLRKRMTRCLFMIDELG